MAKKNREPSNNPRPSTINSGTTSQTNQQKPHPIKLIGLALLLIISTVIVYAPSLKVPFLLDDYGKIIRNPDIKSLDNIPSRLIYPYESPPEFHRNDPSRPLTYLTLTLNYHFSHLEPYGYHVVNIALHAIVVLLIFVLGMLIFPMVGIPGIVLPFLAALLFAVHPINVNVVSYIMGRAASLASVFYLLSVILFIQARSGTKLGTGISAVCFVFALASNQLALTLPAVILITDFCFFSGGDPRQVLERWKQHGVFWGILVVYLSMRFAYFGKLGDMEASVITLNRSEYILTQWVVVWKYAGMVIFPKGLSFEHLFGPIPPADPRFLIATALFGILFAGFIRGLKSSWKTASFLLFGVLWYLITLSPTSSVFPTTATMAENRVYLPSVSLYLIIVLSVYSFLRGIIGERVGCAAFIVLIGCYSLILGFITVRRNSLYQDPILIWTDVIQKYPDHGRAHQNLATEYFKQGNFKGLVDESEKAIAINPDNLDLRNNLAMAYFNLKRYDDALVTFQDIVKINPDYAVGYANLGLVYDKLGNIEAAIKAYQNAIRLNPKLIEPLNNLAGIYYKKGQMEEAGALYQAALRIDPKNENILWNYSRIKARLTEPRAN